MPAARSGIIAGIILGMMRAIGETMAVLMVAGNSIQMPEGPLSHVRTLTMNIATDMKYASGDHWTSLFTTGIVLFVFILILNLAVQTLLKRSLERKEGK
jgi:phosphate transport system permease protein